MGSKVDTSFEELVKMAKKLPKRKWSQLKEEVEGKSFSFKSPEDLERFLLAGPTFSKKQIDAITKTRKAIVKWRGN